MIHRGTVGGGILGGEDPHMGWPALKQRATWRLLDGNVEGYQKDNKGNFPDFFRSRKQRRHIYMLDYSV
jgi:hypothetical protein